MIGPGYLKSVMHMQKTYFASWYSCSLIFIALNEFPAP